MLVVDLYKTTAADGKEFVTRGIPDVGYELYYKSELCGGLVLEVRSKAIASE
ncbi:MAG: hypothetical protein H6742_12785 [Alphaproteobacteria bacterium]|nr:hypothetical protein [Alphaproteobacteria bacterium]